MWFRTPDEIGRPGHGMTRQRWGAAGSEVAPERRYAIAFAGSQPGSGVPNVPTR
jgi:hypothetical protein